jgi:hypothetical protein
MTRTSRRTVIGGSLSALLATRSLADPSPQALLAASDRVRLPQQAFRVSNTLVEFVNGRPRDQITLTVFSKPPPGLGPFSTVARYDAPARDRGKLVLFAGTDLWFYDPSSRASVRISPQQRLLGQASNGDVVTTNFSGDYTAATAGPERLQDADKVTRDCIKLVLSPRSDLALYGRVELWIEAASSRPVKAKFYADSGRPLKIAYYRKFAQVLGAARPTETVIIDAVNPTLATTMTTKDYRATTIPDAWLQREFLPRIPLQ